MYCEKIDKNMWRCIGEGPRDSVTGKRRQITRRGKTKKKLKIVCCKVLLVSRNKHHLQMMLSLSNSLSDG